VAVEAGNAEEAHRLLDLYSELSSKINEPMFSFDGPAVHVARTNMALLDLLLAHGGDLNTRTSWEKGGFGVLEQVSPDEAAPLIARAGRCMGGGQSRHDGGTAGDHRVRSVSR
jgi:hypothetical protein